MALPPLGLAIGPEFAADVRTLVPIEAEPAERVADIGLEFAFGTFEIGVVDAKDKLAACSARHEIVEEGRAGAADMKRTCWTRCPVRLRTSFLERRIASLIVRAV